MWIISMLARGIFPDVDTCFPNAFSEVILWLLIQQTRIVRVDRMVGV